MHGLNSLSEERISNTESALSTNIVGDGNSGYEQFAEGQDFTYGTLGASNQPLWLTFNHFLDVLKAREIVPFPVPMRRAIAAFYETADFQILPNGNLSDEKLLTEPQVQSVIESFGKNVSYTCAPVVPVLFH